MCYTQQRKFELALKDLLYILKDAPDNKEILDELKKLKENWDLDLNEKEREGLELRFKEEIANVKQNLHRNTKGIEQTKTPANKDTPVVDATSKASTGFKKIKIVEEDIPSPKVVSPELGKLGIKAIEIKFAKFMQAGDNVKKQLDSLIKRNLINEAKEVATNCVRDCQHFRNEFETNSDYYVKLSNAITELNTLIEQINSSSSNTKTQKEETKQGQIPKDTARSSADSDSSKYYKTNILSKDLRETATKIAEANINFDDFPKSAFGFEKAFNSFKGKPDVFFNFLKFFTGKTMSNSYQVSEIPYQILAGVILCLRSNLNEDNAELVVDYLRNIPKTKNFQLVKKFLKKSDKENIREICSKLKDKFNITEDFAGLYL